MRTKIIAEVGECFNGNLQTAFTMIREAKQSGCDIVKFQLLDMDCKFRSNGTPIPKLAV